MTRKGGKKKANDSEKNFEDASSKDNASADSQTAIALSKDNAYAQSQTATSSTKESASPHCQTGTASLKKSTMSRRRKGGKKNYSESEKDSKDSSTKDSASSQSQIASTSTEKSTRGRLRGNSAPVTSASKSASARAEGQTPASSHISKEMLKLIEHQIEVNKSGAAGPQPINQFVQNYKGCVCSSRDEKQKSILSPGLTRALNSFKEKRISEAKTKYFTLLRQKSELESQKEIERKRSKYSPEYSDTDTEDTVAAQVKKGHGFDSSDASLKCSSEAKFISFGISKKEQEIISNPETQNTGDSTRPVIFTTDISPQTDALQESPVAPEIIDSKNKPLDPDSDCKAMDEIKQPNLLLHKESNEENVSEDVEKQKILLSTGHLSDQSSKGRLVSEAKSRNENATSEAVASLSQEGKVESQKKKGRGRKKPSPDTSEIDSVPSVAIKEAHGLDCPDSPLKTSSEGSFIDFGITEAEQEIIFNPETQNAGDSTRPVIFTTDTSPQTDALQESPVTPEIIDSKNKPLDSDCKAVDEIKQPNLLLHKESNEENVSEDVEKQEILLSTGHLSVQSSKGRHVSEAKSRNENATSEAVAPLSEEGKVESQKKKGRGRKKPSPDTSEVDSVPSVAIKEAHGLDCSDSPLKKSSEGSFIDFGITEAELEILSNPETQNTGDSNRPVISTSDISKQTDALQESPVTPEIDSKNKPLDSDSDCKAVGEVTRPDLHYENATGEALVPISQEEKVESQKEKGRRGRKHSPDTSEADLVPCAAIKEAHGLDCSDASLTDFSGENFISIEIPKTELEIISKPVTQNTENSPENQKTLSDNYSKEDSNRPAILTTDNSTQTVTLKESPISSEVIDSKNNKPVDSDSHCKAMDEATQPDLLRHKESNEENILEDVALRRETGSASIIENLESLSEDFLRIVQTMCDNFENDFIKCLENEK